MRGYKMMESDMTCMGFQYEVGKEYSLKDKLVICENGFHFCENPLDIFNYYSLVYGIFYSVYNTTNLLKITTTVVPLR